MYYLTVGYPLGMDIFEERQVYQISLRSTIINLIPLEHRIWSRFLLGAYENDVKKTLSEVDQKCFDITMKKLLHINMLVAVGEEQCSGLRGVKFLRQGIGVGVDLEKNIYEVLFREKIELTSLEYSVWKEADGNLTYENLEQKVASKCRKSFSEIQKTVIELCRRGMILAVNYEERQ